MAKRGIKTQADLIKKVVCSALCLASTAFVDRSFGQIQIAATPKQVLIERTKNGQEVSFDFLLENKSDTDWKLDKIDLGVVDDSGNLTVQISASSGLDSTLPGNFTLEAKKTKLLFNPFYSFHSDIKLRKLKFELFFSEVVDDDPKRVRVATVVEPVLFQPKTALIIPVGGRNLVYAGHDFYAHHRRVDLTNPIVAQLGVRTNPTRYGYDFVPVNERGAQFRTDGKTNADWFGFGAPVIAPGSGVVKEVRNNVEDNVLGKKTFDFRLVFEDLKAFYGNYVAIDHQNGEYSLLLHLKRGSVAVKVGDTVKQRQPIAQMGISGDADYVHLHYQLQNALEINNESLPAYFSNFRWLLGGTSRSVKNGALATGDIVENIGK